MYSKEDIEELRKKAKEAKELVIVETLPQFVKNPRKFSKNVNYINKELKGIEKFLRPRIVEKKFFEMEGVRHDLALDHLNKAIITARALRSIYEIREGRIIWRDVPGRRTPPQEQAELELSRLYDIHLSKLAEYMPTKKQLKKAFPSFNI